MTLEKYERNQRISICSLLRAPQTLICGFWAIGVPAPFASHQRVRSSGTGDARRCCPLDRGLWKYTLAPFSIFDWVNSQPSTCGRSWGRNGGAACCRSHTREFLKTRLCSLSGLRPTPSRFRACRAQSVDAWIWTGVTPPISRGGFARMSRKSSPPSPSAWEKHNHRGRHQHSHPTRQAAMGVMHPRGFHWMAVPQAMKRVC